MVAEGASGRGKLRLGMTRRERIVLLAWNNDPAKALADVAAAFPGCEITVVAKSSFRQGGFFAQFRAFRQFRGKVILTLSVAHDRIPALLDTTDICLSPQVPFRDGSPFFGSPTKLFKYMVAGSAIIASKLRQGRETALSCHSWLQNARSVLKALSSLQNPVQLNANLEVSGAIYDAALAFVFFSRYTLLVPIHAISL